MATTEQPESHDGVRELNEKMADKVDGLLLRNRIDTKKVVANAMEHDTSFIVLPRNCWKTYCLKEIMCRELTAAAAKGEPVYAVFIATSKRTAELAKRDVERGMVREGGPSAPEPPVSIPPGVTVEWRAMSSSEMRGVDYATHVYFDDVSVAASIFHEVIVPMAEITTPGKSVRKLRFASHKMVHGVKDYVVRRNGGVPYAGIVGHGDILRK